MIVSCVGWAYHNDWRCWVLIVVWVEDGHEDVCYYKEE